MKRNRIANTHITHTHTVAQIVNAVPARSRNEIKLNNEQRIENIKIWRARERKTIKCTELFSGRLCHASDETDDNV